MENETVLESSELGLIVSGVKATALADSGITDMGLTGSERVNPLGRVECRWVHSGGFVLSRL